MAPARHAFSMGGCERVPGILPTTATHDADFSRHVRKMPRARDGKAQPVNCPVLSAGSVRALVSLLCRPSCG